MKRNGRNVGVLIGFLILELFAPFIGEIHAKGCNGKEKNDASIRSHSCFGPNTKVLLLDRKKGLEKIGQGPSESEVMYQAGRKSEKEGSLKQAYVYYTLSDMAFKRWFPHYIPALIGKYRIVAHCIDKEIEETFGCLALADFYDYYRKIIMLEKIEQTANAIGKEWITQDDKSRFIIMKAFINLMKEIISWETLVIKADDNGILYFGDKQIEFLGKGLLQYGVLLRNGNWELVGKSQIISDFKNLRIENRGILDRKALRFSKDTSFVPGLRSFGAYDEAHKRQQNVWWERIIGNSLWEYSIFDRSIDKQRREAFVLVTKGRVFETIGQKEEAALCYYNAFNILGFQFQEPLMRLYNMKSLEDRFLMDLAKTLMTYVEHIDSIRSQLIGLLSQAGDNDVNRKQINAAIYHSYFLRNIVLGRIFPVIPQKTGHISAIINLPFISAWTKGMREFGIKLHNKKFNVDRLSELDWDNINKTYISSGFWEGCWQDRNGDIMVPGIMYLKDLAHRNGG